MNNLEVGEFNQSRMFSKKAVIWFAVLFFVGGCLGGLAGFLIERQVRQNGVPNMVDAPVSQNLELPGETVRSFWSKAEAGQIPEANKLMSVKRYGRPKKEEELSFAETIHSGKLHLIDIKVLWIDGDQAEVRTTVARKGQGDLSFIHELVLRDGRWQIDFIRF